MNRLFFAPKRRVAKLSRENKIFLQHDKNNVSVISKIDCILLLYDKNNKCISKMDGVIYFYSV